MGRSPSLNGDVRGAPVCSEMTSSVIAALTVEKEVKARLTLTAFGGVLNPEQGPESEDEMDDVEDEMDDVEGVQG